MTAVLTTRPAKVRWLVTTGHTAAATLIFEDENGDALDMSDRTFIAKWADYPGATDTNTVTVDDSAAASGQLILTIDDTALTGVTGKKVWWLSETIDGEPYPLLDGPLEIAPSGIAGVSTTANLANLSVGSDSIQVLSTSVTGPVTTASGIDGGTPTTEGDWFLDGGTP